MLLISASALVAVISGFFAMLHFAGRSTSATRAVTPEPRK